MTKGTRRKHSGLFKAKVALAAIAGDKTLAELAQQFERGLIRERTQAGLAAAKDKGRIGGRPVLSQSNRKVQLAHEMTDKGMKIKDVCLALGISRSTYYRYLKLNAPIQKVGQNIQLPCH